MAFFKYGLIGEKLGHSFSREVHTVINDCSGIDIPGYNYKIKEISRDKFKAFMRLRGFKAINVTIPYKEAVIPYLRKISDEAKSIGAVNTIARRGFSLYGYNTDFFGMKALIEKLGIDPIGKKAIILGSGGTSKTAKAVLEHMGAKEIITVGRQERGGVISYDRLYSEHTDAEIIVNSTPVGMYPNNDDCPIDDLSAFPKLIGVVDAIYNPIRTRLVLEAQKRGIPAEGGLYMLVAQAVYAYEIFTGVKLDEDTLATVYKKILRQKQNMVLIGMPSSGKSTVGKEIVKALEIPLYDTDDEIVKTVEKSIPHIFESEGEKTFRDYESAEIKRLSLQNGVIIATGGGSILREENVDHLKQNGRVYFIDRPLCDLVPTDDRPLSRSREHIEELYRERYELYKRAADVRVPAEADAREVARDIISDFMRRR